MKKMLTTLMLVAATIGILPLPAYAVGPEPKPLPSPVTLTVGYQKVGHLAPMILISDEMKKLGVELKLVEFVRYADARTALLAGSLDIASVGPADLAIALAQGSTNVVGLMGVGSSPKYVIGRKGTKFDSWSDLKGKKIAIAPGSAVWLLVRLAVSLNVIQPLPVWARVRIILLYSSRAGTWRTTRPAASAAR
jgi:sulfonate transport system substrate-binding protein